MAGEFSSSTSVIMSLFTLECC